MKRATFKSYAKINLTLDVLGKRPDGYHEVEMIMHTTSLSDTVSVELDETGEGITVETSLPFLPVGEDNLAYKAARLFLSETGLRGGVKIVLEKHIPVGAGLAGGSSNCAVVLKALDRLAGANLGIERLCEMGAALGADVPYCLLGGARLARGIGEKLSPLPPLMPCHILLVKPAFSISTKQVYEKIDSRSGFRRPDTEAVIRGLEQGDLGKIAAGMANVLEEVSISDYPVLAEVKQKLVSLGAVVSQMSGSGPTVFGIFTDRRKAVAAKNELWGKYKTVYLCKPV